MFVGGLSSPKAPGFIGRNKCPARLVMKLYRSATFLLSFCKEEHCCFVCIFQVLGEGEVEDKVTSLSNP